MSEHVWTEDLDSRILLFLNEQIKAEGFGPANLRRACPTAYTYAFDDESSTFTCQSSSSRDGFEANVAESLNRKSGPVGCFLFVG